MVMLKYASVNKSLKKSSITPRPLVREGVVPGELRLGGDERHNWPTTNSIACSWIFFSFYSKLGVPTQSWYIQTDLSLLEK